MLVDVDAPLEEGETFPLTLVFERSGRVQVDARIGKPGDMVTPADNINSAGLAGAAR